MAALTRDRLARLAPTFGAGYAGDADFHRTVLPLQGVALGYAAYCTPDTSPLYATESRIGPRDLTQRARGGGPSPSAGPLRLDDRDRALGGAVLPSRFGRSSALGPHAGRRRLRPGHREPSALRARARGLSREARLLQPRQLLLSGLRPGGGGLPPPGASPASLSLGAAARLPSGERGAGLGGRPCAGRRRPEGHVRGYAGPPAPGGSLGASLGRPTRNLRRRLEALQMRYEEFAIREGKGAILARKAAELLGLRARASRSAP